MKNTRQWLPLFLLAGLGVLGAYFVHWGLNRPVSTSSDLQQGPKSKVIKPWQPNESGQAEQGPLCPSEGLWVVQFEAQNYPQGLSARFKMRQVETGDDIDFGNQTLPTQSSDCEGSGPEKPGTFRVCLKGKGGYEYKLLILDATNEGRLMRQVDFIREPGCLERPQVVTYNFKP